MVKTQIQLPDDLYHDLKRLAQSREWSLAETLRRAAEQFLARYPGATPKTAPWNMPAPRSLGWRGLTHAEIRAAALDDMAPHLPAVDPTRPKHRRS
jgi:hypothetical protein